jgi:transposase InsO family protein
MSRRRIKDRTHRPSFGEAIAPLWDSASIADWLENFYNTERRHSSLNH